MRGTAPTTFNFNVVGAFKFSKIPKYAIISSELGCYRLIRLPAFLRSLCISRSSASKEQALEFKRVSPMNNKILIYFYERRIQI
jgi:hypothetical protein